MIVEVNVVLNRTVVDSGLTDRRPILSRLNWPITSISRVWYLQLTLTLKMTATQVVKTWVTVNNNSIQDYVHPHDHTQLTYEMTPGFKPFTVPTSTSYNRGRSPFVRTGWPDHCRTSQLANEIGFFQGFLLKNYLLLCTLFRIWLIWLDSFY